jgi:hypothetical protein
MTKDEALDLALEAIQSDLGTYNIPPTSKMLEAITAIKQARSASEESVRLQCTHCGTVYADGVPPVVPVQENTMIYKTFEQWKSGNVLEHGVPRTEYYSEDQLDLIEMGWGYGYDAGRAVEQALDKKADNARELGLDYEPEERYTYGTPLLDAFTKPAPVQEPDHGDELTIAYMSGVHRGKELAVAQAVPDAIIEAGESPEFRDGWNECRETMLQMLKARKA